MPNALKESVTNALKALGTELTRTDILLTKFARSYYEEVVTRDEVRGTTEISSGRIVSFFVPPMVRNGTGVIRRADVVATTL